MAYERVKKPIVLGDSLDTFVSGISRMYDNQRAERNASDELNFNRQVLQNNLSLKDQLAYRKAQLERVADDPTEKKRIQNEISTLTDRIEQQDFSDKYTEQITNYAAGTESIDQILNWMQTTLSTTTDQTIRNNLTQSIAQYTQKRFELTQQMMKNRTDYALKDKTASIINTQISNVQAAKASALLSGDQATAASLDLQLQSLNQALSTNAIEKAIKDMAISTVSGYSSAQNLLDAYTSKIQSSDTVTPVTISGVTYNSAQEYWTYAKNRYLNDDSSSGFFSRIDDEMKTAIKVKNSNNTLTAADMQAAASTYNMLRTRPDLAPFVAKIDAAQADTLQTAADSIAQKVVNTFDNNLDLSTAVNSLNALKNLGANVDNAYQKIITSAAASQSTALQNIISNAQTLMAQTPGLSISDAVSQSIAKGSGIILSPNDLVTKTPGQNATDILGKTTTGTVPPDNRTTMGQPAAGATTPTTGAPGGTPGSTYQIKAGDTLSAIAAKYGTTVQALAQANGISNPDLIHAGATLQIPGSSSAGAAPAATAPTAGLPAYAGAEITGTPTGPFVTVNGKNYVYNPNGAATTAPKTTTPSVTPNPVTAPTVNVTGTVSTLRAQIASGALTPAQAAAQLNAEIAKQSTNQYGQSISGDAAAKALKDLYAPLQINANGKISNLNPDGTISTTSTTSNVTKATGQGISTSTSYQTPGSTKVTASSNSSIPTRDPSLPNYAGEEIIGTPTGTFVTVNGKNYKYVQPK